MGLAEPPYLLAFLSSSTFFAAIFASISFLSATLIRIRAILVFTCIPRTKGQN